MFFTNVHNEFKTKLRKTGGDFIVHSSDFTLQFILHSSHFTLPSFLKWLNIYREIRKTSKFRLHSSYVTVHTSLHSSYFTLHSFLKLYFMYKRQMKVPFQSSQFMDGWFAVSHPIQQYFSHIRTMEGRTWGALCNEAPFRLGPNLASSGIRTRHPVIRSRER